MAAPHMNQRRQIEVRRQLQLCVEQRLLALSIQGFDEIIQADLAHCAQLPMAGQTRQPAGELT
ncbi:hypothetical protein D3C86_2197650 [compost metagenome]